MKLFLFLNLIFVWAILVKARDKDESNTSPDQCELPRKVGPCRAYFPRYFYNAATQECEKFGYGGCGTEGNNMKTKEECEDICKDTMSAKAAKIDGLNLACSFPKSEGKECEEKDWGPEQEMWYYDQGEEACKPLTFIGCGGNQNQFDKKAKCEEICLGTAADEGEEEEEKPSVKKDAPLGEDTQEEEKITKRVQQPKKKNEEKITKRLRRASKQAKKLV